MDLRARYRELYEAGLFTAECAEDAYPLGALGPVLHASIRSELDARKSGIDYCDSRMDVAAAVEGLAAIAPRYAELRRELFSDLHHVGRPASRWRVVSPDLAVLAPLQVWRQPPAYALLLRDPGTGTGGAQSWDFIVHPRAGDPRVPGTTYTTMVFPEAASTPGSASGPAASAGPPPPGPASGAAPGSTPGSGAARRPGTVQVTRQLEEQREHYEQLTYGFAALGRRVRFAALNDPDGGREPQAPKG
ncbi:hypothetical protein B4N89_33400 [Embleya scabrispora]|uniref:Uncharacterized protein n=1 Tax=Embleya scabrispora TaxID=159449 RepID=A0A1T3NQ21_9ACTN|nr:hypothetical protein [Embleya scabrispora]OPC79003.1 hypothetical protein B4N89_33400 [Embleya scabrispora]